MERTVRSLQAPVGRLLQRGAAPGELADAALVTWRSVEARLAPLVGARGFTALLGRSMYLARQPHPWLPHATQTAACAGELLTSLHAALAGQPAEQSAAAHASMVGAFCEVLSSLIGGPLTERVLRPVGSPNGDAGNAST